MCLKTKQHLENEHSYIEGISNFISCLNITITMCIPFDHCVVSQTLEHQLTLKSSFFCSMLIFVGCLFCALAANESQHRKHYVTDENKCDLTLKLGIVFSQESMDRLNTAVTGDVIACVLIHVEAIVYAGMHALSSVRSPWTGSKLLCLVV